MANLEILGNVIHQGIVLKKGMIVSDEHHKLSEVGRDLIDRGLAKESTLEATHTTALVNGAQEPLVIGSKTGGNAPNAEGDAALKAQHKARQQAADSSVQNQVNDQAAKEAETVNKTSVPTAEQRKNPNDPTPTDEQIAASAAAAS